MRDYEIDPEKCRFEVQRNRFNDITTSYYLISKRKERAGIFRQQYKEELKLMFNKKKEKKEAAAAKPAEVKEPETKKAVVVSGQNSAV